MSITIRPETVTDYPQIAELHARAFACQSNHAAETILVDMLRHRGRYDPELSLVAERMGRVIGHAFFSPFTMMLRNHEIMAVNLSPIGILPEFQRKGVGRELIWKGHQIACEKGYSCSFLWGHATYYPRYGYIPRTFCGGFIQIPCGQIPKHYGNVIERPVTSNDIPHLTRMWRSWVRDAELALFPGDSVLDWMTFSTQIKASVVEIDGLMKGYLRYNAFVPHRLKYFLSEDKLSTLQILNYIYDKVKYDTDFITLPVHPSSYPVSNWLHVSYSSNIRTHEAHMIKILNDSKFLQEYCDDAESGRIVPGLLLLPPLYDIC